jgi:hypothetical protein
VLSLDRTPAGIAVKLSEKARVAPEKLLALVGARSGATFTPNGVLRIDLSEEEATDVIETTHGLLLQISSAE